MKTIARQVDWLINVLYEHLFKAEHERFWEMREAGRGEEIDPMWIACYCMVRNDHSLVVELELNSIRQVLALGVDGLRCETPKDPPSFDERRLYRPAWWYGCALRLMQFGDATGRPQVRYIQCVPPPFRRFRRGCSDAPRFRVLGV